MHNNAQALKAQNQSFLKTPLKILTVVSALKNLSTVTAQA
jgi:hypothetical protein